jgi:hypothetical protein
MLPIFTSLELLAPAAARLLRAYGAFQLRRAIHRLQRLDDHALLALPGACCRG